MHKLFILGRAFIYFALGAVLTSQAEPPATISPTTPAPRIEKLNNLERGMMTAPVEQRLAMPKPAMNSRPQGTSPAMNSADVTAVLGKERRTIRIGVEYNSPPLSYVSIPGQPEGFTVELLREVGFIAHIDFVFVQGGWFFLLEEFKAGRIDALANTLINNDRLKFMDFSIGHTALHSITFSRPENSPVTHTSQFVGKKMAALRGTQSYFGAVSNRGWGATIVPFNSYPEMLRAVKEGTCDFALAMRLLRTEFILARPSNLPPQFVEVGTTGTPRVETQPDELDLRRDFMEDIISQFHIAVHKGDANNLAVINEGLATVRANGTFDRLYTKWIGPTEPHKITLQDLRPYLWPIALTGLLVFAIIAWQQAHTRTLARQAAALRKSEGDLRRTNQLGRIGGWEFDLATRKYSWSEQIFHINELDPTGPVPTAESGLFNGYTNADRARVSAAIVRCIADALPFDLEVEKTTAKGRRIWVRIQGSAVREGADVKLVGITQDITARKESEALLRLKNAALEASAEGVIITDRQGIIMWVNPAFTGTTGYSSDEAVGRNSRFLKSGVHDAAFYQAIWETILKGNTWHGEITNRHKSGRLIIERQLMSPLLNSAGEITHFIDVRWEITEEKRLAKQLEQLETQNQQLQKAESLSRMAGAIAHHFNNQLQGIMGNLELLKRGSKEEARAAYVLAAETHALKAAEISGLMLTYLGESTAERGPLDLAEVGAETLHLLSAVAPAGVVLKGDFAPTGPSILGNGKQIYQMISALITNAWEASPVGSATIRLSIQPAVGQSISSVNRVPANWQPSAEAYVCLQVTDTGRGIAPSDISNIYDPFYTVHKQGRGLGLSAVLGLVRSYQGAITVESVVGAGTTFRIFLPLSSTTSLALAAQAPSQSAAPALRGRTVLIVEDDASLRSTVKLALEIADYVVLEAADGVEAVAIFTAHQAEIGCVLCDVMMPRMNGWETLSALRKFVPQLPVIIASGYSEVHLHANLDAPPAHLFLQKPYALADLTHMLRSILS